MPSFVTIAIVNLTLIVRNPKKPSTNMAEFILIYYLLLVSNPIFMFFKEIFSINTFLSKIFSNNI